MQRIIRQSEASECGLACLAMICADHRYDTDLAALRRRFPISLKGATLTTLIEIAAAIGLGARPVRCDLDELAALRTPAILHWSFNHFVVLDRVRGGFAELRDPALGQRRVPLAEVSGAFTGVALELTPTAAFRPKRERTRLEIATLLTISPPVVAAFAQAIVLTLVIELLALATPFYMQLVIDEAILKGDLDFLSAIAIGFAGAALFQAGASALRGLTLQFLGAVLSFDMAARVFHHLVRLPLDWFHKRHVGDVQSRFQAIESIRQFATGGALAAVFDGVFGLIVFALMLLYAPALAGVAAASLVLVAALRFGTIELQRRLAGDVIANHAKEQTRLLETLRSAQTIKLAGQETGREALQRHAIAAALRSSQRSGNVAAVLGALNQLVLGLTDVLIVYLGARAVLEAHMTVGMLTAFLAYKGQFASRGAALIENVIGWMLLDVQTERLADIALAPREPRLDEGGHAGAIEGAVSVRQVFFRYAPGDPEILRGFSLDVAPGEFVAIAGPSGCGKSTLLKILCGLYQPLYGEVAIDGRPLALWNARALRTQLGVVTQDDSLLQGSIAENIAFFDERIDVARVEACARTACIHDDIAAMPMGYQSLVGDMGSALSAGQKQRVLLARALYREPKILILDEGTAHLDVATERAVNAALSALKITRIVVAHRAETLAAADRVVVMGGAR